MTDPLAHAVLEAFRRDPDALEALRELVAPVVDERPTPAAYTVRSLAAELGRSERAIRGAIHRGELDAVRRGRGYLISAGAVERWAAATSTARTRPARHRPRAHNGPGPMARALKD